MKKAQRQNSIDRGYQLRELTKRPRSVNNADCAFIHLVLHTRTRQGKEGKSVDLVTEDGIDWT
jgi:hypothetical protein